MNRAELLDPVTRRLHPAAVAVSFDVDPAAQIAAARRLAIAAAQHRGGLALRCHEADFRVAASRPGARQGVPARRGPRAVTPRRLRRLAAPKPIAALPTRDVDLRPLCTAEVKATIERLASPHGVTNAQLARALGVRATAVGPYLRGLVNSGWLYTTGDRGEYLYHLAA